jgi:hypothetical protein
MAGNLKCGQRSDKKLDLATVDRPRPSTPAGRPSLPKLKLEERIHSDHDNPIIHRMTKHRVQAAHHSAVTIDSNDLKPLTRGVQRLH